jgi:hypothetical protein
MSADPKNRQITTCEENSEGDMSEHEHYQAALEMAEGACDRYTTSRPPSASGSGATPRRSRSSGTAPWGPRLATTRTSSTGF